jgi:hypothetical protein
MSAASAYCSSTHGRRRGGASGRRGAGQEVGGRRATAEELARGCEEMAGEARRAGRGEARLGREVNSRAGGVANHLEGWPGPKPGQAIQIRD